MNGQILKVEIVTGGTNKPTEKKELTGQELQEWLEVHGIHQEKDSEEKA